MEISNRVRQNFLVPAIGSCLIAYFAYYAIFGDRGLKTLLNVERETKKVQVELNVTEQQSGDLRKKVEHLRPNSVDPDLLEERGRAVLNFTKPGELVIMKDKKRD